MVLKAAYQRNLNILRNLLLIFPILKELLSNLSTFYAKREFFNQQLTLILSTTY